MARQAIEPLRERRGRYSFEADIERELRRIDDDLRVYWSRVEDPRRSFFGKRGLKERWQIYRLGRRIPVLLHHEPGREAVFYVKRALVHVMNVEDDRGGFRPLDRRAVLALARMTDVYSFGGRTIQDAVRRATDAADERLAAHRRKLDRDLTEKCETIALENYKPLVKQMEWAERHSRKAPRWTRG